MYKHELRMYIILTALVMGMVSRGQTVFICGGRKKGLVWFTDTSRLDTFECVNILHHRYFIIAKMANQPRL